VSHWIFFNSFLHFFFGQQNRVRRYNFIATDSTIFGPPATLLFDSNHHVCDKINHDLVPSLYGISLFFFSFFFFLFRTTVHSMTCHQNQTTLGQRFFVSQWGVPKIHIVTVVASRAGLELLTKNHPEVTVTVGMIDDHLTDCGIVLPGLGDVGDRLFGTGNYDFEDGSTEPLAASSAASAASEESSITRRKRSASLELEMEHVSKK